ncbi:hypothetical protein [Sphingomonas sp.]|uniref:hypothetical protein n=1 Tax=Sphingomonas sp. TaxID=28214 RepID=UPI003CC5A832
MDAIADLQAQIVALRTATEGVWLSLLLSGGGDARNHAERLRRENLDGLNALHAPNDEAAAMRAAVIAHTDQLWSSIVRQLGGSTDNLT